jgi:glycosyltransferase involved in cell wall biosynthesis
LNAAVMTTKNEQDIVGACVAHLFAEGIDRLYVADASDDATPEILRSFENVVVRPDRGRYTDQAGWTNRLIEEAADDGADWIVPLDADEFPTVPTGGTVAHALWESAGPALIVDVYDHRDRDHRYLDLRHQKVYFRYERGATVGVGSHRVNLPSGGVPQAGPVVIHEWCYRSFGHFCAKARQRIADLSPEYREMGWGGHHARLEGWSDQMMLDEWDRLTGRGVVYDPLPGGDLLRSHQEPYLPA